jgi:AraC family transcriptional regulator
MKNRETIYRSLDLIEENLRSDMTVYGISQRFSFSFYYFSRLFKGITGYSPKSYILKRKITESVKDILNSDKKIIEIAFDYGFSTPESFSRAFQKITGINPSDIRKSKMIDKERLLNPITKENIENSKNDINNDPELIDFGPLNLVGIPIFSELSDVEDLSTPWQILLNNIASIPGRVTPEKYFQVQYWFPEQDGESLFFFLATEVSGFKESGIQFTAKTIPEMKYLKFQHKGLSNKVGYTYQFIYEKWLPETDYKLPYLFNFEYYGDLFKGPYDEESISEIYIPVEIS